MPLSDGTKAIGPAWASAVGADRTAPDDTSLTPPIVVATGYPASFSADAGDTPRRAVINELFYRWDSAVLDIRNYGILPWDTDVDTLAGGVKQVNGVVYRALVDNGPTYANAVSPTAGGQTVWAVVSGTISIPAAPSIPTAVAGNGTLDWTWNCPLDGGAPVTAFDFQWRIQGQTAWSATIVVTTPRYILTGLANGTTYEAHVQATNSQGDSGYGIEGAGTPVAAIPGGGNTLALRADTGDVSGEIDLSWLEPANNGSAIVEYTYQWKSGGQAFTTARQGTSTTTTSTVTGLTNGADYDFRVRATNGVGNGAWSNEDSATPVAPFVPPSDTAPDAPDAPEFDVIDFETILWRWSFPADDGGQSITRFDFQWRIQGNNWVAGNIVALTESCYLQENRNESTTYEGRVRATNIVGTSGWSGDTPATTPAEVVPPPPPTDTVPGAPRSLAGAPRRPLIIDWTWAAPADDGGQPVTSYGFQWRYSGDAWAAANLTSGLTSTTMSITVADATNSVQARVRAVNSVGTGAWIMPTVTVASGDLLPPVQQVFRFTSSQTWNWPYDDLERATAVLIGLNKYNADTSRDISLPASNWRAAASDGTTVWLVDTTSDIAFAYTAATGVANPTLDINLGTANSAATSDGTIVWFLNRNDDRLQAYNASDGSRNTGRDITVAGNFLSAACDGTTIWGVSANAASAYTAATGARNAAFDITLGETQWQGATSDGETIWFARSFSGSTISTAIAYDAATRDRKFTHDFVLPLGSGDGAATTTGALWFLDDGDNIARVYTGGGSAQLTTGGTTYTTAGDTDGLVTQPLSGIGDNASFAITVNGSGFVEVYPQT